MNHHSEFLPFFENRKTLIYRKIITFSIPKFLYKNSENWPFLGLFLR